MHGPDKCRAVSDVLARSDRVMDAGVAAHGADG